MDICCCHSFGLERLSFIYRVFISTFFCSFQFQSCFLPFFLSLFCSFPFVSFLSLFQSLSSCILLSFIQYRHEINPINLVNATTAPPPPQRQQHSKQFNTTTTTTTTASTISFLFRLPFISSLPSPSSTSTSSHNKAWNVINHLSNQFSLAHASHTATTTTTTTPSPTMPATAFNGLLNHNQNNQNHTNGNNRCSRISGNSHHSSVSPINRRRSGIYLSNSNNLNLFGHCHHIIQLIERYQFVSYTVIGLIFYGILFYIIFLWFKIRAISQWAKSVATFQMNQRLDYSDCVMLVWCMRVPCPTEYGEWTNEMETKIIEKKQRIE